MEVESERYGFSKIDHQSVIWRKKEITTFGFIFIRSFYLIMGIAKQLPILVNSTSLIIYRSLLGLKTKLNEHENEIWKVSRVMTQNLCPLNQASIICDFTNLTTPLLTLSLLLSILEALHFLLSISEISKTYIPFISIKIFLLSPQSFQFGLFCFNLLYFKFNNPN